MLDCYSLTAKHFHEDYPSSLQLINEHWEQIPLLNPVKPAVKDGQICRFRGMIQDMPNPVYYYSKYEVCNKVTGEKELRCGKYIDSLCCEENESLNLDSSACENGERRPYFLVPVPGVSEWAQIKSESCVLPGSAKTENNETNIHKESKRSAEDMEVDIVENETLKRHCSQAAGRSLPAPDENTKALNDAEIIGCLVVLYDTSDAALKLNEVLEVVGFVYSEPMPSNNDEFDDAYKPPSPLTPRLHAVSFKKIANFNPLVKSIECSNNSEIIAEADSIRSDLHLALSQLFFGDRLVADYLICHFLARIYHRDDTGVILGKFSLNISQLPGSYFSTEFFTILSKLLPKTVYFPFTIDSLNKSQMLSRKNYKTGHLEAGILQLSDHTHLVIDETKLTEGKLVDTGVKNVSALQCLIKQQKLDYDFTYYSVGFSTDIPVLILSQTKSILPSDIQLSIVPDNRCSSKIEESFAAVNKFLNESLLQKIRVYLSVASNLSFTLPETFQSTIQDDFVSLRQDDPSFNANDLHNLLILSRFLSLSYCKSVLTEDIWKKAKSMIIERRERSK